MIANNSKRLLRLETKLRHYLGKAVADYQLIQPGDRILICLSGGKDSFALLQLLQLLQQHSRQKFDCHILLVDQGFAPELLHPIHHWLKNHNSLPFTFLPTNIFQIVGQKARPKASPCILCSRLRRGHIYSFAKNHNYNKIALGHHRDDLIQSLLLSIFYNGCISSMPPKLLTNDKQLIVIRPLAYCQEDDLAEYAELKRFPILDSSSCIFSPQNHRKQIGEWLAMLSKDNPKIPANILAAMKNIRPSQLMDQKLWHFKQLAANCCLPASKN